MRSVLFRRTNSWRHKQMLKRRWRKFGSTFWEWSASASTTTSLISAATRFAAFRCMRRPRNVATSLLSARSFNIRRLPSSQARRSAAGSARKYPPTKPFSLIDEEARAQLPEDIEDAYPLSYLQQGMLYHSDLHRQLALYHVIFSCQVTGSLDFSALQTTMQKLAAQHPILRTSFDLHSYGQPLQLVHREISIPFTITDLQDLSPAEQKETISAGKEDDKKRGFEWTNAPLLRMNVFICGAKDFRVIISFHHAILDGWSLSSMLSELFLTYLALRDNAEGEAKTPLATTFRDFIALEQDSLQSEEIRNYWSQ